MIPQGVLPDYIATVFQDLYEEDGLAVFGRGLGSFALLSAFVRYYSRCDEDDSKDSYYDEDTKSDDEDNKHDEDEDNNKNITDRNNTNNHLNDNGLVLVLGLNDGERQALHHVLTSWGTPPHALPTLITNEAGQAKERALLYQQQRHHNANQNSGVICITSRILIVDLLAGVLQPHEIKGMLVYRAEQVTEQSTEAFILRIYRSLQGRSSHANHDTSSSSSRAGFVKAFSENPEALLQGFGQVDKVLKALQVRKLYLVPRFWEPVLDELEKVGRTPLVTEFHQALSPSQAAMQQALAAAVQACLRQLKQATPLIDWNNNNNHNSNTELSVENCVTTHFDAAIRRQLEPDWHRLSPATKQLVQDLRTLRSLLQTCLLQYDCVTFWRVLNSLKTLSAASRVPSLWLLTPAANVLFRHAKERLYRLVRSEKEEGPWRLETILEENPKWKLLQQVLQEIHDKHKQQQSTNASDTRIHHHPHPHRHRHQPTTVLVMVKDDKTLDTLRAYLTDGKKRTLLLRWLRYLEQFNDRSRAGGLAISEESRLLLEEEGRVRRILFGRRQTNPDDNDDDDDVNAANKQTNKGIHHVPAHLRKRRRIATERARNTVAEADDLEREAVLEEAMEEAAHEEQEVSRVAQRLEERRAADHGLDDFIFRVHTDADKVRVVLKTFSSVEGDQNLLLLQDMEPDYVIFYDSDLAFIRSVEIYASLCDKPDPIQVFFLIFEASAEEKNYMVALERERSAFERLIHHKKVMPPPILQTQETQEMREALRQGSATSTYMGGTLPLAFDSRKGNRKTEQRRDIAVDVREFRSSLPSILHQGGMRLAPVTLTVGDFVLSNVHCVERKSISDLFGSFASGRLYTQAEAMCRHYKVPCLLIEFDPNKSFCLQSANELGVEIRSDSVCSKMSLLVMHFPKLRILWSRSPHETLKIFKDLKANHEEVDVEKAVEIGRNESAEALLQSTAEGEEGDNGGEDDVNLAAREMLLRLPGVNVHVARRIMAECDSLAELASLSRDDMRKICGPIVGQKLFTFFHQNMGAM